nr:immunoglobulin light chain junction region [Macaca mulatta]MOW56916.1 immunoglobulin light chain junction region [Macaca mulatta]MOW57365.1 immunoglobulin light chain junction region [Macaca mulatta]MOW57383.1 immunoglobulin light chain junction region [Macaca mulatta]MOW57553.1 immunoglobulin light chain junction region [Macaca mulatta]
GYYCQTYTSGIYDVF